jgi:hypothetical protein
MRRNGHQYQYHVRLMGTRSVNQTPVARYHLGRNPTNRGRERQERVSQLAWCAEVEWNRAAASTQTLRNFVNSVNAYFMG